MTFGFDGAILAAAIRATFERRATDPPVEAPIALTRAFADDPLKQSQWQDFLRRTAIAMAPEPFIAILQTIAAFVMPPTRSLANTAPYNYWCPPGGPWMAGPPSTDSRPGTPA